LTIIHKLQITKPKIINNIGMMPHFSETKPMVKPAVKKNGPSQNTSCQSLFLVIIHSREQGTGEEEKDIFN
jgi:hypothetical protein